MYSMIEKLITETGGCSASYGTLSNTQRTVCEECLCHMELE